MRRIAVVALLAFGLFAFCGCGDGVSPTEPTNGKGSGMEDKKVVAVSMTPDESALFDRMQKVGEDPFVDPFQMTWANGEQSEGDTFSCLIVGRGQTFGLTGPREKWSSILATVLHLWESTPVPTE